MDDPELMQQVTSDLEETFVWMYDMYDDDTLELLADVSNGPAVYRAVDGNDQTLYVGKTKCARSRFFTGQAAHSVHSPWWDQAATMYVHGPFLDWGIYNRLEAVELLFRMVFSPVHGQRLPSLCWRQYGGSWWLSAGKEGLDCQLPDDYNDAFGLWLEAIGQPQKLEED